MNKEQEAWKKTSAELQRAEKARAAGNEGRARVCARRAAGFAIDFYLIERLGMPHNQDALKLLQKFQDHPEMPDGLRAAAKRLTKRVTPDHRLPHPQDPLEDARAIIAGLLNSPATP